MVDNFQKFNRDEFNDLKLKIDEKAFGDYQLLVVSPINDASQAMSYFRRVITNRSLFDVI